MPAGVSVDELIRLEALLQPHALIDVLNVHVLDTDGAAVSFFQHSNDLTERRFFEAESSAQHNFAVKVGVREAVVSVFEFRVRLMFGQLERIEVGELMATCTVGADEGERLNRVFGLLENSFLIDGGGCLCALILTVLLGGRGVRIGDTDDRTLGGRPRRPRQLAHDIGRIVAEIGEELRPARVNACRVLEILIVELGEERGVRSRQHGGAHDCFPQVRRRPNVGPLRRLVCQLSLIAQLPRPDNERPVDNRV